MALAKPPGPAFSNGRAAYPESDCVSAVMELFMWIVNGPAPNLIRLRQLLGEKFPGLRTHADQGLRSRPRHDAWSTGLPRLDEQLAGGFPRSAISEVVAPHLGCGSALLLVQFLRQAAAQKHFVALIDGRDSFDAAAVDHRLLARLLWIRCISSEEAVKATDLVLRDGNLPIVLLDLAMIRAAELRKIPAPTWYRFQRIVEESRVAFVVFTPAAMISPAQVRVTLQSQFHLSSVETHPMKLTWSLDLQVEDHTARGMGGLRRTA